MPQCWDQWSEIATVVGVLVAILAFLLLAYQICLQRRELKIQNITLMFSDLNTPDFREALRFVYSHDPAKLTLEHLSDEERHRVEMVTAHLDRLGFRVRKGLVPKEESYHLFWDVVLRTAQQLQLHLQDQREKRDDTSYKDDYDWLAREFKLRHLGKKGRGLAKEARSLSELLEIEPLLIFR